MRLLARRSPIQHLCRATFCSILKNLSFNYNKLYAALYFSCHNIICCRELFKEIRLLGQGNFSKVFHVKNRVDGFEYAVKRSKLEICSTDEALKRQWFQVCRFCPGFGKLSDCLTMMTFMKDLECALQEIQALAAAGIHQHIVRYYFAWLEEQNGKLHFYVQLEKCESSLGQRFSVERKGMKEAELTNILKQVGFLTISCPTAVQMSCRKEQFALLHQAWDMLWCTLDTPESCSDAVASSVQGSEAGQKCGHSVTTRYITTGLSCMGSQYLLLCVIFPCGIGCRSLSCYYTRNWSCQGSALPIFACTCPVQPGRSTWSALLVGLSSCSWPRHSNTFMDLA